MKKNLLRRQIFKKQMHFHPPEIESSWHPSQCRSKRPNAFSDREPIPCESRDKFSPASQPEKLLLLGR